MNSIILSGRLTRDVELRYTPQATPVAHFSIAVDRDYKREGQPSADFFNVIVWGKQAENCANYLEKGRKVLIEGSLQNSSYEVQGEKRYKTEVVASRVEFLDYGKKEESSGLEGYKALGEDAVPF